MNNTHEVSRKAKTITMPFDLIDWLEDQFQRRYRETGYAVPRGVILAEKVLGPGYKPARSAGKSLAAGKRKPPPANRLNIKEEGSPAGPGPA